MNGKTLYPLGRVKQVVEAIDMGISYAHEDLVFLEHNDFLLEFTDREDEILVHFNVEGNADELVVDLNRLQEAAARAGLRFTEGCPYRLSEVDAENIRIEFLED